MKLLLEEKMRQILLRYHESTFNRHTDELADEDLEDIAEWLVKKWCEDTDTNRTPVDESDY